jgi:ribosomal-protein-alanine N-acetyltransferase
MPPEVLTLRPARREDLSAIVAIECASFSDPWSKGSLREEIESKLPPLVAEVDGVVVGYLCLWGGLDELHVTNLAVRPDLRRRGLATRLLEAAIEAATRDHCRQLFLEVRPSNVPARRLYGELGFVELYRRRGYYIDPSEDGLVMVLSLAEPHAHTAGSEDREDD